MKTLPLTKQQLEEIARTHPTPFHIYDETAIRRNARALRKAFAWNQGFKEFFAVKAAPNPFLIKILHQEGFGTDCSSAIELELSERMGITGEDIMFTSNDTPASEFAQAARLGAIINLDDISHIAFLEKHAHIPPIISFRYNPGPLKEGNTIIGHPEDAKYGLTRPQIIEAYRTMRDKGVKRFGLHTMVASNELDPDYFIETARLLFELILDISKRLGIRFEFANLGGGIGIPYHPGQQPVDLNRVSCGVREHYERILQPAELTPLRLYMENGRMITGPYGYLVSRVLHIKNTYKTFVGLDACMAHLMRPALYGAYHHITIPGKEHVPHETICDVTGSLCENNDKFAIDRPLPPLEPGDLVVLHDTGAHGHAMGFNYNGKLRSAELLLRENGDTILIRRAETPADHFSTLDFDAARTFS